MDVNTSLKTFNFSPLKQFRSQTSSLVEKLDRQHSVYVLNIVHRTECYIIFCKASVESSTALSKM